MSSPAAAAAAAGGSSKKKKLTPAPNPWAGEPRWVRFFTGALASMTAEVFTFPLDTVKIRMQLDRSAGAAARKAAKAAASPSAASAAQATAASTAASAPLGSVAASAAAAAPGGQRYTGMFHCMRTVVRDEGARQLYSGVSAALLRQFVYSGLRMGFYEPIRNVVLNDEERAGTEQIGFFKMLLAGGSAGALGAGIATPTDLVKIRFQANPGRYSSLADAFRQVIQSKGVSGLYLGCIPNVQRAVIVNAAELAVYDYAKQWIVNESGVDSLTADHVATHFLSSASAGFAAAVASTPVDVAKSRVMNQSDGGVRQYKGMGDCLVQLVREEGVLSLWKGFLPTWLRIGPWAMIMFLTYEQYRGFAKQHVWQPPPSAAAAAVAANAGQEKK